MFKRLLTDSVVYGVAKYLGVFASIFLMPIYTRLLTKADYGIMEIVNSWNALVVILLPLGLSSSILRFQKDFEDDENEKKRYLGTILLTLSVLCLAYGIFMLFSKPLLIKVLGAYPGIDEIYLHGIAIATLSVLLGHFLTLLQAQLKKFRYLTVSLVNLCILVTLGFTFVYHYRMGILGFFRASSIALTASVMTGIIFTRDELTLCFSRSTLRTLLKYSIHILSVNLLFSAINLLDRYILVTYAGLPEVGVYSIGVRISGIMGLAVSSFALAWFPLAMRIKDNPDSKEVYKQVHNLYCLIALTLYIGIIIGRKELIEVFAPGYEGVYGVIAYLSAHLLLNGSIYFYSLGLHIKNTTKYFTYTALVSTALNVALSIALVDSMGVDGVALGTLAGCIAWVVILFHFSQRIYPIDFDLKRVTLTIALGASALIISPHLNHILSLPLAIRVPIKLALLALIGTALAGLFFGRSGLKRVLQLLRERKRADSSN